MIRSPKEIEHIPTIKDRQSLPFPIPHIQTPTFHPCIALRKASPPLSPYLFIADFTCRVLDPARYESVLRWLQQITEPDTQNSMSWQGTRQSFRIVLTLGQRTLIPPSWEPAQSIKLPFTPKPETAHGLYPKASKSPPFLCDVTDL